MQPVAYTMFTDDLMRPVYEDERGHFVIDEDGCRVDCTTPERLPPANSAMGASVDDAQTHGKLSEGPAEHGRGRNDIHGSNGQWSKLILQARAIVWTPPHERNRQRGEHCGVHHEGGGPAPARCFRRPNAAVRITSHESNDAGQHDSPSENRAA